MPMVMPNEVRQLEIRNLEHRLLQETINNLVEENRRLRQEVLELQKQPDAG